MAEQGMAFSPVPQAGTEHNPIGDSVDPYISSAQNPDEAEGIVELAAWLQRIVAPS